MLSRGMSTHSAPYAERDPSLQSVSEHPYFVGSPTAERLKAPRGGLNGAPCCDAIELYLPVIGTGVYQLRADEALATMVRGTTRSG